MLLETGGALLYAAHLFRRDVPFYIHNVDVISDINLRRLYAAHVERLPLASLAVMQRDSKRYLLFDEGDELCGYGNEATGFERVARAPRGSTTRLGFSGVHVASPDILDLITETGAFSIITLYMRLAAEGHSIVAHRVDTADWIDIGRPEHLTRARETVRRSGGEDSQ
jgi:NDP-sugar pyrophosphorylase family protein